MLVVVWEEGDHVTKLSLDAQETNDTDGVCVKLVESVDSFAGS